MLRKAVRDHDFSDEVTEEEGFGHRVPPIRLYRARATLVQLMIARRVPIDVAAATLDHTVQVFTNSYLPRASTERIREHARAIVRAA